MSGIIDEALNLQGDVIGGLLLGVGAIVSISAIGVAAGGVLIADGLSKGVKNIKASISYLKDMMIEEQAQYQKAFDRYQKIVALNQNSAIEYLNRMKSNLNLSVLGCSTKDLVHIEKKSNEEQAKYFNLISQFSYYSETIQELLFHLSEEGTSIPDIEESLYGIKDRFVTNIKKGNLSGMEASFSEYKTQVNEIKTKIKELMANHQIFDVEHIDNLIFVIENEIGIPYLTVFYNELRELLEKMSEEKSEESLDLKLYQVKKEIIDVMTSITNLEYIHDFQVCQDLVDSVNEILVDDRLSKQTKLSMVIVRKRLLDDKYLESKHKYSEVIKAKNNYDELYYKLSGYMKILELESPTYEFSFENINDCINQLKVQIAKYEKPAIEKKKSEYIRKSLREIMNEFRYEHIESQDIQTNGQDIHKDIYHIENGNVLAVTLVNNDQLTYRVSGIKMDGIAEDKASVVNTMKKFCDKKSIIKQKLNEKGINTLTNELFDPDIKWAEEIKLSGNVDISKVEIIRKNRMKKVQHVELKHRVVQ